MGLETTNGYKNGKDLARQMAQVLKKSACDLSEPIPLSFYLYLPDRRSANACAKVLKADGHEVEVEKSASDDSRWLCLCHVTIKFSEKAITPLGDRLLGLAKEHKGEFDGWETNPYKSAQAFMDLMNLLAEVEVKKN
jgi:regulator of ribonuclease activity B